MMIIGAVLPVTLGELAVRVVAIAFGAILLWRGQRLLWLFGGVVGFLVGLLVVRLLSKGLLGNSAVSGSFSWVDLVAVLTAALGVGAALKRSILAYGSIGLAAGGALGLWGAQLFVDNGSDVTFWIGVAIIAVAALGALFTLHYGDVAVIILSAVVGVAIIAQALGLSGKAQWEAALLLSLALASVAVQCHDFLMGRMVALESLPAIRDGSRQPAAEQ